MFHLQAMFTRCGNKYVSTFYNRGGGLPALRRSLPGHSAPTDSKIPAGGSSPCARVGVKMGQMRNEKSKHNWIRATTSYGSVLCNKGNLLWYHGACGFSSTDVPSMSRDAASLTARLSSQRSWLGARSKIEIQARTCTPHAYLKSRHREEKRVFELKWKKNCSTAVAALSWGGNTMCVQGLQIPRPKSPSCPFIISLFFPIPVCTGNIVGMRPRWKKNRKKKKKDAVEEIWTTWVRWHGIVQRAWVLPLSECRGRGARNRTWRRTQ